MRPLRIYLDSNDYSVLSDPKFPQHRPILEKLKEWISSGHITCHFSGAHLSEMAPLTEQVAVASRQRAELLTELCGRRAMIAFDALFTAEVGHAIGQAGPPCADSPLGDWFPGDASDLLDANRPDLVAEMKQMLKEAGLTRAERRRRERTVIKSGKLRQHIQAAMVDQARAGAITLPLRQEHAKVYSRYVLGDATRAEAQHAVLESLREPAWLMEWIGQHLSESAAFSDWVRRPGANFLASLKGTIEQAAKLREQSQESERYFREHVLALPRWKEFQDSLIESIAARIANENFDWQGEALTAAKIDRLCPGLSIGVRSLHSAIRTSFLDQPRKALASDFPDAIHAMYAPYVDVFRADSFMAPHIAAAAGRHPIRVVSKLTALVAEIDLLLATDGSA